jgi:hypothetical protein
MRVAGLTLDYNRSTEPKTVKPIRKELTIVDVFAHQTNGNAH